MKVTDMREREKEGNQTVRGVVLKADTWPNNNQSFVGPKTIFSLGFGLLYLLFNGQI